MPARCAPRICAWWWDCIGIGETRARIRTAPSGRGKLLPSGKRSQYVPLGDISRIEAAIERGKRLTAIEKEIRRVQTVIDQLTAKVAALGGKA
ncbi:hypothetical protein H6F87_24830 [Cyanobacteria bacterium FACHB-502]|nr:hypothetical protein [Cyanobacteria bacterium FACHB-502]